MKKQDLGLVRSRRRWQPWAMGALLGASAVLAIPLTLALWPTGGSEEEGARRAEEPAGSAENGSPARADDASDAVDASARLVTGDARLAIQDFGIDDPSGRRVLQIDRVTAAIDVEALRRSTLRMPRGQAQGVRIVLRRGSSGRLSLAEAVHGGAPPPKAESRERAREGILLDLGPLQAEDVRLRVEMGARPVIVQLRAAALRVTRSTSDEPTRILLEDIRGRLVSPDPLPKPIEIHDGRGVINLAGNPLVELSMQVCVARGELRLRVEVPERAPDVTTLIVDGDALMGVAAAGALHVVGWLKDSIEVRSGPVDVPGSRRCDGDE